MHRVPRSRRVSSQIPGIPASGSAGVAGTSSVARVAPARALVPIAPTEPRAANPLSGTPLGRSGLDLADLLGTQDSVAARQRTPSVALEVGLERARGALLRNLAGDALAALDLVWEGARRTEEGWYLRGSALTVLGLPGESDRIAQEGLHARPGSTALRFLQSLARLALGDVAGARHALQPALQTAPNDPLLLVQQAVVQARQGDSRAADALLQRVMRMMPDHPALDYGRAAVRAATADVTRSVSRATPPLGQSVHDAYGPADGDGAWPDMGLAPSPADDAVVTVDAALVERAGDVVDGALERFGARLLHANENDVAREGRLLVRAFSAGGTLASACSAEQAHAARGLLTAVVGVLLGESGEGAPPLRALLQQIIGALRDGRTVDAERALRRAGAVAREPTVRLLQLLVGSALAHSTAATGPIGQELRSTDGRGTPANSGVAVQRVVHGVVQGIVQGVVQGPSEVTPLVPVRLGLALLTETAEERFASRGLVPSPSMSGQPAAVWQAAWQATDTAPLGQVTGSYRAVPGHHDVGEGWGAAQATAALHTTRPRTDLRSGAGVRAVALLCVGLAAAALSTGNSVVAIALGIGAAWLALRRSSSRRRSSRSRSSSVSSGGRADGPRDPLGEAGARVEEAYDVGVRDAGRYDSSHGTEPRR